MSRNSNLTGTAGEHFVVYQLSCLGLIAALPRAGAEGVDILVSNNDGSKTLAIQVKTTDYALRTRVRTNRNELQFPLGRKSAKINSENLFFAFVDLRTGTKLEVLPDVYAVPSPIIYTWCKNWVDKVPMVRLHKSDLEIEPYKNNWASLLSRLVPSPSTSITARLEQVHHEHHQTTT